MKDQLLRLAAITILLHAGAAFAKPEFPADLDQRCTNAGRLPANPSEVARAAQPVLGDCALCHAFDFALGQFPSGGNVTREGDRYKQDLDPFCTLPAVNQPPTLAPIGNQSVEAGSLLSLLLMADDGDGDPLIFSIAPLPLGASFTDGGDGMAVFDWTPASNQVGNHSVEFSVSDGLDEARESIVIAVSAVDVPPPPGNLPPMLAPTDDVVVEVGEWIQLDFSAVDPDGDALRYGVAGLPTGAEFTDLGGGAAELLYLPDLAGTHLITLRVMDDGDPALSVEDSFQIRVVDVPVLGDLQLDDGFWIEQGRKLRVRGGGADPLTAVEIIDDASGALLGVIRADEFGEFRRSIRPFIAACSIRVRSGGVVSEPIGVRGAPGDCGEELLTYMRRTDWKCGKQRLRVAGKRAPALADVQIHDADGGGLLAETQADARGKFRTRPFLDEAPERIEILLLSGGSEWRIGPFEVEPVGKCRDEDRDDDDEEDEDEDEDDEEEKGKRGKERKDREGEDEDEDERDPD